MFKIKVLAKLILIVLLILSFYAMPYGFYPAKRMASFILFILIAFIDGTSAKYFSFIIAFFGALLYNPFHAWGFTGPIWDNIERWLIAIVNIWLLFDIHKFLNGSSKPQSKLLKYLKWNEDIGMYEVFDGSYKYEISKDLIDNLHDYMESSRIALIGDWYNKLSQEERKKVRKYSKFVGR